MAAEASVKKTIEIRADKKLAQRSDYAVDESLVDRLARVVYKQGIRQCIGKPQTIDAKHHEGKSYVVYLHKGMDVKTQVGRSKVGTTTMTQVDVVNPFLTKKNGQTQTHRQCIFSIVDHAESKGINIQIVDEADESDGKDNK